MGDLLAKIAIGKRPDLTYEILLEILKKNLPYHVQMWLGIGEGVSIWKNTFQGTIVQIKQTADNTYLNITANPPSVIVRLVCVLLGVVICGCLTLFILSISFTNKVTKEIRNIPEFKQTA